MAASTTIVALPAALQLAQAVARVVPGELSKSPLLGILGVIMGAGIVTLTGRMLTLGLADLKGHLGIGFDSGAWISSASWRWRSFCVRITSARTASIPSWAAAIWAFAWSTPARARAMRASSSSR